MSTNVTKVNQTNQKKRKALSLFSGIGGLCEGVKLAGFEIVGAVESDKYAAHNYRLNFPDVPLFTGDINAFLPAQGENSKEHFDKFVGTEELDLIFGGPPCQGYSQIGPRDPADPRNELYLQLIRLAERLKPKCILIENVPNMLLMKNGMFRDRICNALREAGYKNIGLRVLIASDYGVPQDRKRVFILASRPEFVNISMQDAIDSVATSLVLPSVSVNEALSDLPMKVASDSFETLGYPKKGHKLSAFQKEMRLDSSGVIYEQIGKETRYKLHDNALRLHNHHTKEIQEKRLALIKLLLPGKKANSLPKDIWDNARPEKWRRFDGNRPAHTLLAQMHRDLSEWIHPTWHRWITVREALRLQSFHDGFVLATSEWQQLKQIGNAVPPLLGRVPASGIAYALDLAEKRSPEFERKGQLAIFTETSDVL